MSLNPPRPLTARDFDGTGLNIAQPGLNVAEALAGVLSVADGVISAGNGLPPTSTLASTAHGNGAALVGVEDPSDLLVSSDVEDVLSGDIATGNGLKALAPVRRVRAATTANVASFASVSTTLDGITLVAGDRVLVKAQTTAAQNGIYVVGTVGGGNAPWTRAADMAATKVIPTDTLVGVSEGTLGANQLWMIKNAGPVTIATTGLTFALVLTSGTGFNKVALSQAAENEGGETIAVSAQIKDWAGNNVAAATRIHVTTESPTASSGVIAVTTGTQKTNEAVTTKTHTATILTDATGLAVFTVTGAASDTVEVIVTGDACSSAQAALIFDA